MKNALYVIMPYKWQGMWVFDDARVGLEQEPFVSGADVIMERFASAFPNGEDGFLLTFSAGPFPAYTHRFEWVREEYGGNWYRLTEFDIEGWLCPALFLYFETAPKEIYVKAAPR
jgi:hypothetical protein